MDRLGGDELVTVVANEGGHTVGDEESQHDLAVAHEGTAEHLDQEENQEVDCAQALQRQI